MSGKHRRVIPRRRRDAVIVTSAALAAGGLLAATGFAALDANPNVAGQPLKVSDSGAAAVPAGAAPARAPVVKEVGTADPANTPAPASVATAAAVRTPTPAATSALVPVEIPMKLNTAARAVSAALTQQGTPYVYGGNAPGGFDCSGLVQWIYKKVGIALPRTAAAQATAGHRVSLSQLQPGDLLFFYQPVEHVVIYVGNGKIVEASQPGQPVRVRSLYLNGFVEARRIV